MNCLSPSLLSADFANLGSQVFLLDEAGAQYVHIDVMDGAFAPNITIGPAVIKSIRPYSGRVFDVHLMVKEPERYIDDFVEAGADLVTVHAEACIHLDRTVQHIKERGALAGVAINPATPVCMLEPVLGEIDMALLMSVNPGFGGQRFIPYVLDKIRAVRQMMERQGRKAELEVDGGVTLENVSLVLEAGASVIVAGSAVFCGDAKENVRRFLERMEEA